MKKNKNNTITLTPIQLEVLNFLGEQPTTKKTISFKDGNMENLIINYPASILEHLSTSPVHLAKIRNAIDSDPAEFENYFNGNMYLDDDMADQPFLCFVAHVFKWCGCAVGIDGRMEGLYQIMKAVDDKTEKRITFQEFQEKIDKEFGGDNLFCILMDSFDEMNLFEHGGSVFSSWLSKDGQVVYKHLQEWMKTRNKEQDK